MTRVERLVSIGKESKENFRWLCKVRESTGQLKFLLGKSDGLCPELELLYKDASTALDKITEEKPYE